jgi:hypothetical protein
MGADLGNNDRSLRNDLVRFEQGKVRSDLHLVLDSRCFYSDSDTGGSVYQLSRDRKRHSRKRVGCFWGSIVFLRFTSFFGLGHNPITGMA